MPSEESERQAPTRYRADIDGLRALAVVSVILFHAGSRAVSGGFVGVDIFFVISGYLITQYIDREIAAGHFSILGFYERRIRRILPALFFVIAATAALSLGVLFPYDLSAFAKSIRAAVTFTPNILFLSQAGYFDPGEKTKPLLHLWSLGVEEQFYVVFPLIVVAAARKGRTAIVAVVVTGTTASFAAAAWAVADHPSAAFYLAQYRAWELMLGSLVALGIVPPMALVWRNGLAAAALLAMTGSILAYSSRTPFPGVSALLPCLGAAVFLYANEASPTVVGRWLGARPLAWIGLISYSLYLWHWPLLVLIEYEQSQTLTNGETFVVITASFLLAAATWKFVEQPFRTRRIAATRASLFGQAAAMAAILIGVAAIGAATHGLPSRFSSQALAYDAGEADHDAGWKACLMRMSPDRPRHDDFCRLGAGPAGAPDFILWGDSHAAAIEPAFKDLASQLHGTGWFAAIGGCAPLLGVWREGDTRLCPDFNEAMVQAVARNHVRNVVLAARWDLSILGRQSYERDLGLGQVLLMDPASGPPSLAGNRLVFERGLRRTLERLRQTGARAFLLLDTQETFLPTPRYLAQQANRGRIGPDATITVPAPAAGEDGVRALLMSVADAYGATIIDVRAGFCRGGECQIAKDGRSLYADHNHLSRFGAQQLEPLLRPVVAGFLGAD